MQLASPAPRWAAGGRAFGHIARFHPELTALRRDLHAHPELGFEEVYTAGRVAEALKLCGVDEVHTGIGRTGVVGVIRGRGTGRRMIGLLYALATRAAQPLLRRKLRRRGEVHAFDGSLIRAPYPASLWG